jgi:hypothetical protein
MRVCKLLAALCACGSILCGSSAGAQSTSVRISGMSDIAFGLLSSGSDATSAQNVCAFSTTATKGYHVTASGSGASGAFTLANSGSTLAYEVQWNKLSGQSSGTNLTPNVALTGQTSAATQQQCNSGPASSATLIVVVRGTAVGTAAGGNYSGTLTLLLGPE